MHDILKCSPFNRYQGGGDDGMILYYVQCHAIAVFATIINLLASPGYVW